MELLVCVALIVGGLYWFERRSLATGDSDPTLPLTETDESRRFREQTEATQAAERRAAEAKAALDASNARIAELVRQMEELQRSNALRNDTALQLARGEHERELARVREEVSVAAQEAAKLEARATAERAALAEASAERARRLRALLPRQGALQHEIQGLEAIRDQNRTAFYAAVRLRLAIVGRWPAYKYATGWELADEQGESTRPFNTGSLRPVPSQSGEGQAVLASRGLIPSSYPEVLLLTPEQVVWLRQLEDYTREGENLYRRWQDAERELATKRSELEGINRELASGGTNSKATVDGAGVVQLAKSTESKTDRRNLGFLYLGK